MTAWHELVNVSLGLEAKKTKTYTRTLHVSGIFCGFYDSAVASRLPLIMREYSHLKVEVTADRGPEQTEYCRLRQKSNNELLHNLGKHARGLNRTV